mgnify:CR=1 FL=1
MDTIDPPVRVMALHALAYCERLFYLEEVEEIRVADAAVYAGRALHAEIERDLPDDGTAWMAVDLGSDTLGLTGRVDCLKRRDGLLIPYEHKRGRHRKENKEPAAWPSDAIQIGAYAMLLEEHLGRPIDEGRIRYHATNTTIRVPIDERLRDRVRQAVGRANELRRCIERPPIASEEHRCIRCSLAPVCLPEEVRQERDPAWEPIRLFPQDRQQRTIHVVTQGAKVSRSGDTLSCSDEAELDTTIPIREVSDVVLHGFTQITTQAIRLCADHDVGVHWVTTTGRYITGLTPGPGPVQRRLRQYAALSDPTVCLGLARRLAHARAEGQLRYILRSTRGNDGARAAVAPAIQSIRHALHGVGTAESLDSLRGHEGSAAAAYFEALRHCFSLSVPESLRYTTRSRRPPKDRFNALLSFGYGLLYQKVLSAILVVGLEPALGFYHTPRSAAHPLVLDLMELFRVPLWDIPLIGSINRGQWNPEAHFSVAPQAVWLSEAGRKQTIDLFESRLQETWKHPITEYSMSYARQVELEVRLLEKEWTGEPGLFARMRLR